MKCKLCDRSVARPGATYCYGCILDGKHLRPLLEPRDMPSGVIVDGAMGIYVPEQFAVRFDCAEFGIAAEDRAVLLAGPDHELYWDTWDEVLGEARTSDGYTLAQDGDLFLIHPRAVWCDRTEWYVLADDAAEGCDCEECRR